MRTIIYALIDPRTEEIRYIGKTSKKLSYRLNQHLAEKSNNYRKNWINSLVKLGLVPVIEEIDICDWKDSSFWEIHYISLYKSWGCKLTNLTEGGDGAIGWKMPEAVKAKIRKSKLGKYEGINNPMYGKKHSKESLKLIGSRPVVRLSNSNELLDRFETLGDAKNEGYSTICIVNTCKGRQASHKSYKWMYEADYQKISGIKKSF